MIPLTDDRLRQLAYDDMVCINDSGRAMAVELLAARARIAELEAAQRPPLGYVVLGRSTDTVVVMSPRMRPTREDAAEFLAEIQRRIAEDPEWAGTVSSRFIAELREAQP